MSVKPDFCNIPRMYRERCPRIVLLLAELADGATVMHIRRIGLRQLPPWCIAATPWPVARS